MMCLQHQLCNLHSSPAASSLYSPAALMKTNTKRRGKRDRRGAHEIVEDGKQNVLNLLRLVPSFHFSSRPTLNLHANQDGETKGRSNWHRLLSIINYCKSFSPHFRRTEARDAVFERLSCQGSHTEKVSKTDTYVRAR